MTGQPLLLEIDKPEWLTQMEAVLEVLNEGVVIANDQRKVLFANSRFVEMTGIPRPHLVGSDFSRFYSSQEWDFLTGQNDVSFRQGHNRFEFVLPKEGGGRLPVIISSRVLENCGNRLKVATFTDISKQVRAEEELRSANARLQQRQMEIDEDLRLAARVQNSLAPKSQAWDNVSVDSFYHPVHWIGGDFALVNSQDDQHVSLLVCDVSGHGLGSALVANRIYSETTSHLRNGTAFIDMFERLNRLLIEDIAGSGMFVTLAAVRISAQQRRMDFAGAGHPPVMVARRGQRPLLLESRCAVLGLLPKAVDVSASLEMPLEPDDCIVLYTDGITEVFDSRGEMLGVEGFQEIVRQASALPAEQMKQGILDGVAAWRNGPSTDDVSLILAHVR
jgi:PAS domain S-box-containing protein